MNFCKFLTRIPTKAYRHAIGLKFIFALGKMVHSPYLSSFKVFPQQMVVSCPKISVETCQKLFPAAQRALLPGALLYGYLLRIEDRQTYQCLASYLELSTGLRRGELLGLQWADLDLEQGILRVRRQVARINGQVMEAPLKTKNAYRTLALSVDAVGVLQSQKKTVGGTPWVFP